MNITFLNNISTNEKGFAIRRLTALWAFVEAGLGGMLHAFKIPFTGLIVGGMAILMITLIAHFSENRLNLLFKSLIIVLIVKAIVSPHSPIPAYFAVSFQAITGYFFYSILKLNSISILLVSIISMLESAIQKLIILTIFFGVSFWKAINQLIEFIFSQFSIDASNGKMWIVYMYLGIYLIGGVIIGFFIKGILKDIFVINKMPQLNTIKFKSSESLISKKKSNKLIIITLILALISLFYLIYFQGSKLAWVNISRSLIYTVTVLIVWYIFINPIILKLLHKFLKEKEGTYKEEVNETLKMIPAIKEISLEAWKFSASKKGIHRFRFFTSLLVYWTLTSTYSNNIIKS